MYVWLYACRYVITYLCSRYVAEVNFDMNTYTHIYIYIHSLFLFLSMPRYFGIILHAVIYMLVSFAGDAVTSIMVSVSAFPLQF